MGCSLHLAPHLLLTPARGFARWSGPLCVVSTGGALPASLSTKTGRLGPWQVRSPLRREAQAARVGNSGAGLPSFQGRPASVVGWSMSCGCQVVWVIPENLRRE